MTVVLPVVGPDANPANDCGADCGGVWGGSAQKDKCGVCSGKDECLDCRGVPFGPSPPPKTNPQSKPRFTLHILGIFHFLFFCGCMLCQVFKTYVK